MQQNCDDKAVKCNKCNSKWIHIKCNKITNKQYQQYQINPDEIFECKMCNKCSTCEKHVAKKHHDIECDQYSLSRTPYRRNSNHPSDY